MFIAQVINCPLIILFYILVIYTFVDYRHKSLLYVQDSIKEKVEKKSSKQNHM